MTLRTLQNSRPDVIIFYLLELVLLVVDFVVFSSLIDFFETRIAINENFYNVGRGCMENCHIYLPEKPQNPLPVRLYVCTFLVCF